jgi:hypothetical protein
MPAHCPTCEAAIGSSGVVDPQVPGVTAIDATALLRGSSVAPRQRGRLLSFLTGDVGEPEVSKADLASIAPPDEAVRREMLRLQIEADQAQAIAETVARKSEVLAERGIHLSQLVDVEPTGVQPKAPGTPTMEPDPAAAKKGPTKG